MTDKIPLWDPLADTKRVTKALQEHTGSIFGRLVKPTSQTSGLAPGTVVHVGKQKVEHTQFRLIDYTPKNVIDKTLKKVEEAFPFKEKPTVTWLDTVGLHETEHTTQLGTHFSLHTLIQEDIVNTTQRPSFEDYGKYVFITLKMLSTSERGIEAEHVSLVLGKNFVLSFQERSGDAFEGVRKRIQEKRKIIERGADYLAYALIDAIVDQYFIILERVAERMGALEVELNENPTRVTFRDINALKRELILMRKSVWPLREVLNSYKKSESQLVKQETRAFINDVYDHTIQVIDTIESLRDVAGNMTDVYLSSISNKMNEIMKVLTIFAAIFIPLTFVAGVYGMNFDVMPELRTQYGYYVVWGVFIVMAGAMLVYFRKKNWL